MTDYSQELVPPDYRNLVINPGGETSIGATWFSSNGSVRTGSTAVTPVSGAGVAEYTVVGGTNLPYFFAPFGPSELVHRNAFKIPYGRTISTRVRLRSSVDVWVNLQAQFFVWNGTALSPLSAADISSSTTVTLDPSDTGGRTDPSDAAVYITGPSSGAVDSTDAAVFVTTTTGGAVDPADSAVFVTVPDTGGGGPVSTTYTKLVGGATWVPFIGFGSASLIPTGATHWSLRITVAGSEPAGFLALAPPAGSRVYADQAMVSDSGASLTSVAYLDGNTAGSYWEGIPNYSTSRTGTAPVVSDPGDPTVDSGAGTTPPTGTGPPTNDGVVEYNPPTLVEVVAHVPTTVEIAEDIFSWKYTPRHLCVKSDIQLANLRLNSIDEEGVLWLVSDIEGWWTLPEPDVPDISRGWFDGSYETRGRYNARVFTITGSFIPSYGSGSVASARGRLTRAANLCHRGDWFMTHEDATAARTDTKGSKVWLSGQPLINTVDASGRTDFSIGLRAPDPIKYRLKRGVPPGYESLSLSTSSSSQYPNRDYPREYPWTYPEGIFGSSEGVAINFGDTVVWPILKMSGPTRGPVVITNSNTGQRLRIAGQLDATQVLVINCFTKEVTLNGVGNYRWYLDLNVDWLMIQPGSNRIFFEEEVFGSERTSLEVQWRSGWIG